MKKGLLCLLLICLMLVPSMAMAAKVLLFIPQDNRPVSLKYTVDTLTYAGYKVLTPPIEYIAGRDNSAQPEKLWEWLMDNAGQADVIVASNDALIYGGLVASRKHELSKEILAERLKRYESLKERFQTTPIYAFATIMRSPKMSAGGVEPDYYDKYGPQIFQYCALMDKMERGEITKQERSELVSVEQAIPKEYLADWLLRREKNLAINEETLKLTRSGVINYFLLGRDDSWPYSQSGREKHILAEKAKGLSADKFITFNGADQLGLLLLTRAVNNLELKMPTVADFYTEGVGGKTVPTYQDVGIEETVRGQIFAVGALPINALNRADLVVAVNTPVNGVTLESADKRNAVLSGKEATPELKKYVADVAALLNKGKKVAVSDVAFGNGADNNLMALLADNKLLARVTTYSGWNTASNTDGYAVAQGLLADKMTDSDHVKMVAVRYLDDWAYQANVRQQEVLPEGSTYTRLGKGLLQVNNMTNEMLHSFEKKNFTGFSTPSFVADHPWDRMFEVGIIVY